MRRPPRLLRVARAASRSPRLAPPVLLLGDERLRRPSAQCSFGDAELSRVEQELHAALARQCHWPTQAPFGKARTPLGSEEMWLIEN